MKKERDCGMTPYPIYPMMQGAQMGPGMSPQMMGPQMGPGMAPQMMGPQMGPGMSNTPSCDQQLNSLNSKVNNLEKRVTALENKTGNSYNESNYYMV